MCGKLLVVSYEKGQGTLSNLLASPALRQRLERFMWPLGG